MALLESWLLDILACPRCRQKVTLSPDGNGLVCAACAVVYPIDDGIPRMLPDSGVPVPADGTGSEKSTGAG